MLCLSSKSSFTLSKLTHKCGFSSSLLGIECRLSLLSRAASVAQDMAVIISRALSYAGRGVNGVSNEKFVDDTYIASYSRDAVYALRQAGVMQGDDIGRFNPLNPANRAEAAKVICSVLN